MANNYIMYRKYAIIEVQQDKVQSSQRPINGIILNTKYYIQIDRKYFSHSTIISHQSILDGIIAPLGFFQLEATTYFSMPLP